MKKQVEQKTLAELQHLALTQQQKCELKGGILFGMLDNVTKSVTMLLRCCGNGNGVW